MRQQGGAGHVRKAAEVVERGMVVAAGAEHDAGAGLAGEVVAGAVALRARFAVGAGGGVDEARVALPQRFVVEAELAHDGRADVEREDVRLVDEAESQLAALWGA